jgi:hypothetical protein
MSIRLKQEDDEIKAWEFIAYEFVNGQHRLSVDNLTSVAVAVAQEVIREDGIHINDRIPCIIAILKRLVHCNDQLTVEQKVEIDNIIDKVMPAVLAILIQVEQGCIKLCKTAVVKVESWWDKCWKKNSYEDIQQITTRPSLHRQITALTDIANNSPIHSKRVEALNLIVEKSLPSTHDN